MKRILVGVCSIALSIVLASCGGSGSSSLVGGTTGKSSGGSPKNFRVAVKGEIPLFAKVSDMDVSSYGISAEQMFISSNGKKLYVFGGTEKYDFNKKLLEYDLTKGVPTKASRGYALATENREMLKLVTTSDDKIGFFIGEHNVNIIDLEKFKTMNIINLTNKKFGDSYYKDGVLSEDKKYFYLLQTDSEKGTSEISKYDISDMTKEKDQSFSIKELSSLIFDKEIGHIDISKDGNSLYMISNFDSDGSVYESEFAILDISDKKDMHQAGSFPIEKDMSFNLAKSKKDDGMVYVSKAGGISTYDVRDINHPKIVSYFACGNSCDDLSLSSDGNILVCADTSDGVNIFDMSDVKHPSILRSFLSEEEDAMGYQTQNLISNTQKPNGYIFSSEKGELRRFTNDSLFDENYVSRIAKNFEGETSLMFVVTKAKDDSAYDTIKIDNEGIIKTNDNGRTHFFDGVDIRVGGPAMKSVFNATGIIHFDVSVENSGKTYKGKATLEVYDNDK